MRDGIKLVAFVVFAVACSLFTSATTPEQAAELFKANTPDAVRQCFANWHQADLLLNPPANEMKYNTSHFQYLDIAFPGDANSYVLLAWAFDGEVYWRLIRSEDGGRSYSVYQDSPSFYQLDNRPDIWNLRLEDLTGDGVPEILIFSGPAWSMNALAVLQWKGGALHSITPVSHQPGLGGTSASWGGLTEIWPAFLTNSHIDLDDLDGDGQAEIIVYPSYDDSNSPAWDNRIWVPVTPTEIYKYDGNTYTLWKQFPPDDKYPITVPSIAVLHPGTLALSELSSPGKGDLQLFVSHPAGTNTVDDIDTSSFTYNGAALSFKKRWANQKQPDTTSANWEWEGCPVKQTAAKGQGEWNPSPEDPFLPSPDGKTEYHFVGPYLELRLARSVVFPYLLEQAQAAFAKEPNRQTYFIEISISGKMKNGKLAALSAQVCVKNTGCGAKAATQETGTNPIPARKP